MRLLAGSLSREGIVHKQAFNSRSSNDRQDWPAYSRQFTSIGDARNHLHGTPNELNLKLSYALRYPYRKGGNPMTVRFRLNGNPVEFDGADDLPLLWYLRDHEKLTGTRFGCGIASCGAC